MEYEKGSIQYAGDQESLSAQERGSLSAYFKEQGLLNGHEQIPIIASEENVEPPTEKKQWNWKKEILFLTLFASNVFALMSYALMGPLFPGEAKSKGVSYSWQGVIFGSYALTQVISSPWIGRLMRYTGYKCIFITGTLLMSIWNIIFGFLPLLIEDRTWFIISCFVCRICMAVGITMMNNAIFVIVALTWPDDIAFRIGTMETAISIGCMLGPVASGLADVGGYYLPYLVVGLLPILPAIVACITMEKGTQMESSQSLSIFELLKIPGVIVISLVLVICNGTPVMLEPTLAPHLKPYGLSLSLIGAVFLINPLGYAIAAPILGKLNAWVKYKLSFIVLGTFGMGLSFFFLGPSAMLGLKPYQNLWPFYVSLGANGVFWAFSAVPAYERFIHYATQARPDVDTEVLMSVLGSLLWMMISGGDFVGPVVAGTLLDAIGFAGTMDVAAMLCLSMGTLLLVTLLMFGNDAISCDRFCRKKTKHLSEKEEKEALLASLRDKVYLQ